MAQQDGLDEVDDGVLLVVVELVERFEVEAELVVGETALILVEHESVGADGEADGEGAEDLEVLPGSALPRPAVQELRGDRRNGAERNQGQGRRLRDPRRSTA